MEVKQTDFPRTDTLYAFGQAIQERTYNAAAYRYSINGQEKDTDIDANHTTALYWEYDSRIGRRWNTDPIVKEWESSYMCFGNNPILLQDRDGDDWGIKKSKTKDGRTQYDITVNIAAYNGSKNAKLDMAKLIANTKKSIENTYKTNSDIVVNTTVNIRVVKSFAEVGKGEHLLTVLDNSTYSKFAKESEGVVTNGYSHIGGLNIIIPERTASEIINEKPTGMKTISHELGHTGGLLHQTEYDFYGIDQVINVYDKNHRNNLMNGSYISKEGKDLLTKQFHCMYQLYSEGKLNQKSQFTYKIINNEQIRNGINYNFGNYIFSNANTKLSDWWNGNPKHSAERFAK